MPAPRELLPGRDPGGWVEEGLSPLPKSETRRTVVRGIRGAITCEENTSESILAATSEMLKAVLSRNDLSEKDIAAIFFTVTPDLDAAFPARAARDLGLSSVALMCSTEIPVRASLQRCIRALVLVNWDDARGDVSHVYLGGAAGLRPDLTVTEVVPEEGVPEEAVPAASRIPRPREGIAALSPYEAGLSPGEVTARYGLASAVKLASNENPMGPPPKAVKAASAAVAQAHLYPQASADPLREAVAARFGLEVDQVVAGAGSDELIRLVATAYAPAGSRVVMPLQTFSQYRVATILAGAVPVEVPLDPDMRVDLDGFLRQAGAPAAAEAATEGRTTRDAHVSLVFVCNPNNPTGTAVDSGAIGRFLERLESAPGPPILVVVDEAYVEFADDPDRITSVPLIKRFPNLVVVRTFSKAYGLAGMRVGYSLSHPSVAQTLLSAKPPFTVGYVALQAALAALNDAEHLSRTLANNRAGKAFLSREFEALGLDFIPTQANFILVRFGPRCAEACESLLRLGVIVRPAASFGLPHHVRITVGTPAENRRLLDALYELAGNGLLECARSGPECAGLTPVGGKVQ